MAQRVAIEPRKGADAGKAGGVGEEPVAPDAFIDDGNVSRSAAAASKG